MKTHVACTHIDPTSLGNLDITWRSKIFLGELQTNSARIAKEHHNDLVMHEVLGIKGNQTAVRSAFIVFGHIHNP